MSTAGELLTAGSTVPDGSTAGTHLLNLGGGGGGVDRIVEKVATVAAVSQTAINSISKTQVKWTKSTNVYGVSVTTTTQGAAHVQGC